MNWVRNTGEAERRSLEAIEWFVRNESENELSSTMLQAWSEWVSQPENNAAYEKVVKFYWDIRSVPTPPLPTDADLRADVESDPQSQLLGSP